MAHDRVQRVQVRDRVGHVERDDDLVAVKAMDPLLLVLKGVQQAAHIATDHELRDDTEVCERFPDDADKLDDAHVLQRRHELGPQEFLNLAEVFAHIWEQSLERDLLVVVRAAVNLGVAAAADERFERELVERQARGHDHWVVPDA